MITLTITLTITPMIIATIVTITANLTIITHLLIEMDCTIAITQAIAIENL